MSHDPYASERRRIRRNAHRLTTMSMIPFLAHVRKCDVCRAHPRCPCAKGWELFNENAYRLARTCDPKRAKA